jgi:hypothetical protein
MQHIVLTEEQMRILGQATAGVEVRDPQGRPVSFLWRFTPQELEAVLRHRVRQRPSEPGIPSARVQAMLQKAHEIDGREGMTPEKMADLLRQARAGEPLCTLER